MKPINLAGDWKAEPPVSRGEARERINILLVDDQPANLFALEALLDGKEYSIVKAFSGQQALRCMLKQDFALVLLDVVMPGLDGFETAGFIRQRAHSQHTPIIFITAGSGNDTHVSRGYSLGAVDYIYKPIVPEILKAKVHVIADLYRKTARLARSEEALRRELEERRRADEAKKESELQYHELFSRASDAIVVFDCVSHAIADANKAALKLYAYSRKEFLGLTADDLNEDSDGPKEELLELCYKTLTRKHRRGDGSSFPAELTYGTFSYKGRKMIMALTRDITERHKAQEAERLREREAMQRQMVATVSHELRTPIAAIKASAETLRRGGVADKKSFPRFISIIESQSDRLASLVDDLLVLAELESRKVKPVPHAVALRPYIKQFVGGVAPIAKRKQVTIDVDVPEEVLLWVDRGHLAGIFQNLIDNAIKYNRKGGAVGISARRGAKEVEIAISDTGIGIPTKDLTLVFQQFHRSSTARALSIKGTGLGLYIIKTMVECNGGRIWAESEPGRGSTFRFTLPTPDALRAEPSSASAGSETE
ncbi:MAG: response regulator [Elusimicrobia bacterium]|nr:response regulator [Elusimicrobiota bacterium]